MEVHMKRWHSGVEIALMRRRWKLEMEIHGYDWRNPPELSCNPAEQGIRAVCHCAAGIGALRRRKPHDCGKARCCTCHAKFYVPKARAAKKREEIKYSMM